MDQVHWSLLRCGVQPDEREVRIQKRSKAGMAELADAADSKSADPCGHGGSTPPPGTNEINSLD